MLIYRDTGPKEKREFVMRKYMMGKRITWIAMAFALAIVLFAPDISKAAVSFQKQRPVGLVTTAVGTGISVSWEPVKGATRYLVYEGKTPGAAVGVGDEKLPPVKYKKIATTKVAKVILTDRVRGLDYKYFVVAQKKSGSKYISTLKSALRTTTVPVKGKSTIKNFLRTGLAPIGSTMYIWGGGWTGQDIGKKTIHKTGISKVWREFAADKTAGYNYKWYLFRRTKGLDCSGYVGFCVYNIRELKDGRSSYVTFARNEGKMYAGKGFGKYVTNTNVKDRKAGDIMTSNGHVWICLGECSDGSAVVMHSSPPAVGLAGTPAKNGKKESKAVALVRTYMKKYYPALYKKYPKSIYRGSDYNKRYGRMRWNAKTLEDPECYRNMPAEKIMADLFGER